MGGRKEKPFGTDCTFCHALWTLLCECGLLTSQLREDAIVSGKVGQYLGRWGCPPIWEQGNYSSGALCGLGGG